jgi:hypothetical protein
MFDTNILPEKIAKLKEKFENGNFADALIGAVNTGNGLMQQRIFALNEDILGQSFGPYVGKKTKTKLVLTGNKTQDKRNKAIAGLNLTPYQRKRAAAGRQILKKDLEFTGNLRRSMVTAVQDEKSAVIEFNNDEAALIAQGQEIQITNLRTGGKGTTRGVGVKIFRLNQSERETVVEQGLELIAQELRR